MIDVRFRNDFFQSLPQAYVSLLRFLLLPGLMILASIDDVIEAGIPIDPEVIVRITRIPKKRFRNGTRWHAGPERIARVQGELCLEKRCTREAGQSHERIVCCHHHPIETDPIAVDLNTVLFRIKLPCRPLLATMRTV